MTDVDLFGNPDPPPRKGDIGYLTWIAELTIARNIDEQSIRVCLDPYGWHPNRRCHTATLPRAKISGAA